MDEYGNSGADAVVAMAMGHLIPWILFVVPALAAMPCAVLLVGYMAICMMLGIPKEQALWFFEYLQ